uniref:Uncharacterized protein n=1 Tax=Rhizophora mucronata TaxID=61149 RepID=A0A2P2QJK1_RHIMU
MKTRKRPGNPKGEGIAPEL